jgi:peroxiredoxin
MEMTGTRIGGYAPDFEIPGVDGDVHHLFRYLESHRAIAVVFMGNHCPYVQKYLERLKQLQAEFAETGFTIIGINSNDANQVAADSFDNMKIFAIQNKLNFPYLWDSTQDVARSFGAEKTPHVFLVNADGVLCYAGSIDDNCNDANGVTKAYLQDAVIQILSGNKIEPSASEPVGCSIKWRG